MAPPIPTTDERGRRKIVESITLSTYSMYGCDVVERGGKWVLEECIFNDGN